MTDTLITSTIPTNLDADQIIHTIQPPLIEDISPINQKEMKETHVTVPSNKTKDVNLGIHLNKVIVPVATIIPAPILSTVATIPILPTPVQSNYLSPTTTLKLLDISSSDPYTEIVCDLMAIYRNRSIDMMTIADLIIDLMQAVEKYTGLTGATKKNIVIDVIKLIIAGTKNPGLIWLVEYTLPSMIDIIIAASRSEFVLNLQEKTYRFCCCKKDVTDKKQMTINSLIRKPTY